MGFQEAFSKSSFYFKIAELALAITGTIIQHTSFGQHDAVLRSTMISLTVGMANCIITVCVLLLMLLLDSENNLIELCLNGGAGIFNIALGVWLFCFISDIQTGSYLAMSIICICLGIVFVIDCIFLGKNK